MLAWLRRLQGRTILVAAWVWTIVYAYPGYMNYDVADQLLQLRHHHVDDYHPPILAGYWRIFEWFVTGPITLLLLQVTLFIWGIHSLLRTRLSERAAASITAAFMVFPPILTPIAVVWKDAQMAAFLIAGFALLVRESRRARIAGVVVLGLAAAVRYNGGAALPTLLFFGAMMWRRKLIVRLAMVGALLVAIYVSSSVINRALTDANRFNWYRTTAMFDIVGIGCYAPPLSDAEMLELLPGITIFDHTNLQKHFCERYPAGARTAWYSYAELFEWHPEKAERIARKRAWKRMVLRYPGAYLQARALFAADVLGLIPEAWEWEPVGQDFAANDEQLRALHHDAVHSKLQEWTGEKYRWLAKHTPLYRPWVYALLSLLLLGWALWKRDALVACLLASGLMYELSILMLANAPDFRYSHWMVLCSAIALVFRLAATRRDAR